jgi:hypothetical protein
MAGAGSRVSAQQVGQPDLAKFSDNPVPLLCDSNYKPSSPLKYPFVARKDCGQVVNSIKNKQQKQL